jgi:hypothetical protein
MWKFKSKKAVRTSDFIESEGIVAKRIELFSVHAYIEFTLQDEVSGTVHKFNTSEPRQGHGTKLVHELLERFPNRKWTVLAPNIRSGSFFAKWNREHGDIFFYTSNRVVLPIDSKYVERCVPLD